MTAFNDPRSIGHHFRQGRKGRIDIAKPVTMTLRHLLRIFDIPLHGREPALDVQRQKIAPRQHEGHGCGQSLALGRLQGGDARVPRTIESFVPRGRGGEVVFALALDTVDQPPGHAPSDLGRRNTREEGLVRALRVDRGRPSTGKR